MYTTQGGYARKFVIVTMIEPFLWLILVHLLSPPWKYGILFLQNIQSEGGTPMDRFGQAPPHFYSSGQYGKKICLWPALLKKIHFFRHQIDYSHSALFSITTVAVSSQAFAVPTYIGG